MATNKKKEKTPPPAQPPAAEQDKAESPAPKKGKLKFIVLILAAMIVGGGLAFAAMTIFFGGSETPPEAQPASPAPIEAPIDPIADPQAAPPIEAPTNNAAEDAPAEGEAAVEAAGPQNIEFKPFVVNLSGGGGKRFLKLTMSVDADSPELAAEINSKMHQFQDIILLLLSSLSYDDISTLDGKMRLRNQMLNRINTNLTSGKVRSIYFSEFVVQ